MNCISIDYDSPTAISPEVLPRRGTQVSPKGREEKLNI